MVRYKIILYLLIIAITTNCSGPLKSYDLFAVSIMVNSHIGRQGDYKEIAKNERDKMGLQAVLKREQEKLTVITNKLKKRYTSVQQIIHQVGRVPNVISLIKECKNYQKNIKNIVVDEPKLIRIVAKTQVKVLKKTAKMLKYIFSNVIVGGKFNLMTNEQRLKMIDYVVNELKELRELLYGVETRLKKAYEALKVEALIEKFDNNLFLMNKKDKINLTKDLEVW